MANDTNVNKRNSEHSNRGAVGRRRYLQAVGGAAAAIPLAGCLQGGADVDEVVIGNLQNQEQLVGVGGERAAQMAVDDLNEDEGILDAEVTLITENTSGQPSEAATQVERLVERENVDVLVGTYVSEVTQAIVDYVAERDVPFLITGSADPATLQDTVGQDYEQYKNVFRTGPVNSDFQAEGQADYLQFLSDEHGLNSVAVVPEAAAWTSSFVDLLPDLLDERGLEVVYQEQPSVETDDWGPVLASAEEAGAEIFHRFLAHASGPTLPATWAEGQFPMLMEGIHVASQVPEYWHLTEGAVTYETTADTGGGGVAPVTENTIPFVERYRERFDGEDPPALAPMFMGFNGYDAVHVYKNAVERAGTVDYENDLDTIVEEMLATDYTGVAGHLELYGPDEEYPHDLKVSRGSDGKVENYPIKQWRDDGSAECVYHPSYSTGDHELPPWFS